MIKLIPPGLGRVKGANLKIPFRDYRAKNIYKGEAEPLPRSWLCCGLELVKLRGHLCRCRRPLWRMTRASEKKLLHPSFTNPPGISKVNGALARWILHQRMGWRLITFYSGKWKGRVKNCKYVNGNNFVDFSQFNTKDYCVSNVIELVIYIAWLIVTNFNGRIMEWPKTIVLKNYYCAI